MGGLRDEEEGPLGHLGGRRGGEALVGVGGLVDEEGDEFELLLDLLVGPERRVLCHPHHGLHRDPFQALLSLSLPTSRRQRGGWGTADPVEAVPEEVGEDEADGLEGEDDEGPLVVLQLSRPRCSIRQPRQRLRHRHKVPARTFADQGRDCGLSLSGLRVLNEAVGLQVLLPACTGIELMLYLVR